MKYTVAVPAVRLSFQTPETAMKYNPHVAPDPQKWLALDEQERIDLARDYHSDVELPDLSLHATIHAIIENQIALDDSPARRTLERLLREGLDRHNAIHAIGGALAEFFFDVANMGGEGAKQPSTSDYYAALEQLTAESWLASSEIENKPQWIISQFAIRGAWPAAAIRAARAEREIMVPIFLDLIENHVAGLTSELEEDALLIIFHLLGEWREKSAYRPLARMLRLPEDRLQFLGDTITENSQRVMAAVFDGDPQPLYDIILEPRADEYVRSAMFEALGIATLRGESAREEATRFLRSCFSESAFEKGCYAWQGWHDCIAVLGLAELKPLVEQAYKQGYIDEFWSGLDYFEEDLQRAVSGEPPSERVQHEYSLIGDVTEELSRWACFKPKETEDEGVDWDEDEELDFIEEDEFGSQRWTPPRPSQPTINPFKGIGRNDPCPCGSGKKYKKCCLNAAEAAE